MSDDFRIEDMTDQECWAILDRERFGRLAVAVHGEPDIFPINFIVDGNALLMRTATGDLAPGATAAGAGASSASRTRPPPT